ncbi:uncharacterized protein LOC135951389 [Calliphora vicina]|uniref:uncharacterized protein LOC135951389 n=1 Tax=Calliphora vicina TaxID=7373 RepID=UPI00325ACE71
MELNILQKYNIEDIENPLPEEAFELLPCQKKFKLKPEDEISLDSIFSALLDRIEPTQKHLGKLKFEVPAKDLLNEKQAIIFEEQLYISKLKDNSCKLNEETKIFLESELEELGEFKLRVEESYDGYVVLAKSKMLKGKGKYECGHWVKGKYDDKLNLICEKRSEYDFVDNARIEKTLDVRLIEEKLITKRETKINNDNQRFKAVINVKGRDDVFILDGGVLLLMRYLIVNNFRGDFHYFSMNLIGKIIRCQLTIREERKQLKMFHRTFKNAVHVINTQYFNNYPQEVSETFYTVHGKMILHYWHNFNYLIHETKGIIIKQEPIVPKLELMWRSQNQLLDQYRLKKKLTYENAMEYFEKHPELSDFLHDYVLNVLKYKPRNILEFTVRFFQKFKKPLQRG